MINDREKTFKRDVVERLNRAKDRLQQSVPEMRQLIRAFDVVGTAKKIIGPEKIKKFADATFRHDKLKQAAVDFQLKNLFAKAKALVAKTNLTPAQKFPVETASTERPQRKRVKKRRRRKKTTMNALHPRKRIEHDSVPEDARIWSGVLGPYHTTPINRQAMKVIGVRSLAAVDKNAERERENVERKKKKKQLRALRERWTPYLSDCLRLGIAPVSVPYAIELEIEKSGGLRRWLDLYATVPPSS
jgi:hypothetical protein